MFGQKKTVPIESIHVSKNPYPLDDTFIRLYQEYLSGKLPAQFALIVPSGIRPHSDYVPDLDTAYVAQVQAAYDQNQPPAITVYPMGDLFVMADDYHLFHTYRAIEAEAIPCYVLGEARGPHVLYRTDVTPVS